MATFEYRALTADGRIVKNRVDEINKQALSKKLKDNGLSPISIEQYKGKFFIGNKAKKNVSNIDRILESSNTTAVSGKEQKKLPLKDRIREELGITKKVTLRDISIFTQDFYVLKKANFNNVHALSTIINSTENPTLVEILKDILAGIEAGEYMYKTMEYYEEVFPYIYINIIRVGEVSGSLENALFQAVDYLEDTQKLNSQLKSILIPNIVQFVLLIVMLFVGTLFAIPQIQKVFVEVGTKSTLPAVTLAFQAFVNGLLKYWPIPTLIIVAIVTAIIMYIRTPKGSYKFDLFKYKMPVFGKLIFAIDYSRLLKAMLLNLKNGIRIQDALEVSRNVIKNQVMLSIIEESLKNILIGKSWVEPFEKSGLASSMLTEMLHIGMQTDLIEMTEKLVDYMKIDIDNEIARIMKVLPQILYSIVGVVLILFVLIVVAPMVQVYMGNFLFDAYLNK